MEFILSDFIYLVINNKFYNDNNNLNMYQFYMLIFYHQDMYNSFLDINLEYFNELYKYFDDIKFEYKLVNSRLKINYIYYNKEYKKSFILIKDMIKVLKKLFPKFILDKKVNKKRPDTIIYINY